MQHKKKSWTNLDSILKRREITLPTKVHIVKAMVSLVVMYRRENWTIKNAECQRIDAFELYCWRRLERNLDCKIKPVNPKGNQPWIFIGRTDAKAEVPIVGYLMWRTDSLEKTLMLGKIEDRRRRGWQKMRWLDGITTWWACVWASSGSWWWTGKPGMLQSMESQKVGHEWVTELNWTLLTS